MPVVMALVLVGGGRPGAETAAAVLFAVAAATDFVDGYLARRWRAATVMGAFLDTTADKLLVAGALLALVEVGRAWAWVAFIIIGREFVIMALRGLAAVDQVVVKPSVWGKLKATVQYVAIVMAMLRSTDRWGRLLPDEWAMLVAAAVTAASGLEYLARFWPTLLARQRVS